MLAIEAHRISKTFRQKGREIIALKDLNLEVNAGAVFGFVGPNGAGKSTTIKILLDIIGDYQGEVTLYGTSARQPKARQGLGYVPETPSLHDELTPLDLLRMAMAMHGVQADQPDAHARHWLEQFGIGHAAEKRLRTLSKGTAQRAALAHALVVRPRMLILDEPLSGLDPIGRRDVVEVLANYKRDGGTIFFTSHVLHDVERIADRFGLIHKGELRTVQSPHELLGTRQRFLVRTVGDQNVLGMTSDAQGRWFAEVDQDALWPLLNQLQSAHHAIVEVKPSLTLETAFMQYVGADKEITQ